MILDHFKKEDHERVKRYLHCIQYCSLQAMKKAELKENNITNSFKRDIDFYLSELRNLALDKRRFDVEATRVIYK